MKYWLRACALTLVLGLSCVLPAAAHTLRSPIRQVATQPSSLQFGGSYDIVRTTNLPLLTQFTIEAWVRRTSDSGGYQTFLSDANSSYQQVMFGFYVDGGPLDCGAGDQFAYY